VSRKPKKLDYYLTQIAQLWPGFEDDGLSWFPDWIYRRWELHLAGRVHDWHFCSRCHLAGSMTRGAEKFANRAIRKHSRELLPWWIRATPFILYYGVKFGAHNAWDSCGPHAGERCRHNIKKPAWMRALGGA
jgi:hypothetical protein